MRAGLLIALVVIAVVVSMTIAKGMSGGTNIDERQKHWEKEIAGGLRTGATKDELTTFANHFGQVLHCHQDSKKGDLCDFDDNQSKGGTRSMPMKLSVIFVMKDDRVSSHQFETSLVSKD